MATHGHGARDPTSVINAFFVAQADHSVSGLYYRKKSTKKALLGNRRFVFQLQSGYARLGLFRLNRLLVLFLGVNLFCLSVASLCRFAFVLFCQVR